MNDYINIDSTIAESMDGRSQLTSSYLSLFTLSFRGHGHGDLFAIMKLDAEGFMYSWEGCSAGSFLLVQLFKNSLKKS
jgi:hypothetical protein